MTHRWPPQMLSVEIGFVAYLQTKEVITKNLLSLLGNLETPVGGIIERNACQSNKCYIPFDFVRLASVTHP